MKILSVDDVSMIRQLIKKTVESMGGTFLEASNGIEALSVLEQNDGKVDLILSDWNMPQMDGFHFLKSIKTNPRYKHIPVVMVTTASEKNKIIQAVQAGASNYLVKPFTDQQLMNKIMDCLNLKHTHLEACMLDALKNVLKLLNRKEIVIKNEVPNQESQEAVEQAIRQGQLFHGQIFVFGEINAIVLLTLTRQNAAALISQINYNQSPPDKLWDEEIISGIAKFTNIVVKNAGLILQKACINVQIKAPLAVAGYIFDTEKILFNKVSFMTCNSIQAGDIVITQKILFV